MSEVQEFQKANDAYASSFSKGNLPMPPGRHVAVLTCMDARLDPARFLGLEEGDAHVIRNAGGRDRKSTRLNSSHSQISYAVFCLKKKIKILSYTIFQLTNDWCLILVYNLQKLNVPTKNFISQVCGIVWAITTANWELKYFSAQTH